MQKKAIEWKIREGGGKPVQWGVMETNEEGWRTESGLLRA